MARSAGISDELNKVLAEFVEDERATIDKAVVDAAKEAKREAAAASPGSGSYKKGWRVKTNKRGHVVETTVYNATDWQLTHLLENSHIIKNQWGTYERTSRGHGQVIHIKPAEEKAVADLEKKLRREL